MQTLAILIVEIYLRCQREGGTEYKSILYTCQRWSAVSSPTRIDDDQGRTASDGTLPKEFFNSPMASCLPVLSNIAASGTLLYVASAHLKSPIQMSSSWESKIPAIALPRCSSDVPWTLVSSPTATLFLRLVGFMLASHLSFVPSFVLLESRQVIPWSCMDGKMVTWTIKDSSLSIKSFGFSLDILSKLGHFQDSP